MPKISGYANGNPPVDTDEFVSARAGVNKKFTWANIKATLKTYLDTLYLALVAPGTDGNVLTAASGAWISAAVSAAQLATALSTALPENTAIILDAALSADGKYSGIVESGTAGAALAFGDLVYFSVADSRWELADADAQATAFGKLGICVLVAAGDGSATTILLYGKVRADAVFPALIIGAPVFVGTTTGDIQTTAPSGAADIIRIVGYGNTADELFFCPSPDYFEHV